MLFVLVICLLFIPTVYASDKNLVNIYMFYSNTCPHCASEKKLLNELEKKYDSIRIYKYEVSEDNNSKLLEDKTMAIMEVNEDLSLTAMISNQIDEFNEDNNEEIVK